MAAQTWNARQTAQDINAALRKAGIARSLDAKRVRAWVRDNVDAYDDDGYTAHVYDATTHARIVKGIMARYTASGTVRKARTASDQRGSAATQGRKPASAPAKPRSATIKPVVAPTATVTVTASE